MNNDELKLSYYQSMIFIYELNKMKRNNKYFNDPISDSFELYMLNKTKELVLNYPQIVMDFKQKLKPYVISQSMYKYLVALTSIDPLDKETVKLYISLIKQEEEEAEKKMWRQSLKKN